MCFLCSERIFSCKSHRNFFQKLPPPMQAFSGKPPREKPQNAAAEKRKLKELVIGAMKFPWVTPYKSCGIMNTSRILGRRWGKALDISEKNIVGVKRKEAFSE